MDKRYKPGEVVFFGPGEPVPVIFKPASLCYDYPLRPDFLAQLVVPRDISRAEAKRLCAFIETLAIPAESGDTDGP